ncbi:tetratricopeptide repeat protein 29 isoform X2 [Brachyhypopomus gauderio]|uniref:tetratricopeptide repeat protein 29 isoform X2 n=1 Tax=Brachyhypopomus gauderio TaxID=698409 RepID=UPI0040432E83
MASTVLPTQKKTRFLPDINAAASRKGLLRPRPTQDPSCPDNAKSETTTITEDDIAQFRNSLRQNICVWMLREGFHRSFTELQSLLERWKASRLAAGPGSALWLQRPLEDQPRKLEALKEHLTRAETAERAGQHVEVYENYLALARFFSEPEGRWLRCRFYELSLLSARKVKMDCGRREAEANGHVGQTYLEQGDFEAARVHYEAFHELAVGRSWQDEGGHTHQYCATAGLCRVYTLLAQRQLQCKDYRTAIQILTKAYDMAKEGGDRRMEGEAAYRVGLAYQSMGNQRAAKEFLSTFAEISRGLGDADGLGKAYKAIAQSLESEGKVGETIEHLQKYFAVSQEGNQEGNLQDACMSLGTIYTSRGQYDRGSEYFTQAYGLACSLGTEPLLRKAQACVSIARALTLLRPYSAALLTGGPQSVRTLIRWKEAREDGFSNSSGRTAPSEEKK